MKRKALLLLLLAALLAVSCIHEARVDSELLATDVPCLKVKGKMVHLYDEANGQLGYNASLHQFRVGTDNMSDFFILTCDREPREAGERVTATLYWTQDYNVQRREGIELKVEQVDADGTVRLWNGKESIGAVVRILR